MKRALLVLLALCGSARAGGILTTGPGVTLRCTTTGQVMTWSAVSNTWTCSAATGVTGAGVATRVAVWNGTASLTGYSPFTSDSSGNVTVANVIATTAGADTTIEMVASAAGGNAYYLDSGATGTSWTAGALSVLEGGTQRMIWAPTATTINHLSTDTLTLHGATSIDSTLNMNSNKITSCANGTVSSDGACFGQIGTAVNAAVAGSTPFVAKFVGANAVGTSSIKDNLVTRANGTRVDVLFGGAGVYDLSVTADADNNANAYIFQNAYEQYNTGGDATLLWDTTHGSFGSRGVAFKAADGISFYADAVATTAGSSFTPTRRMLISNAGGVTVDQTLTATGTFTANGATVLTAQSGTTAVITGSSTATGIGNQDVALRIRNTNTTTNNWGALVFETSSSAAASIEAKYIDTTNHYADINFATRAADGYLSRLTIASAGGVTANYAFTSTGALTASSTLTQTAGNVTLNTSSGTTAITGHGATNLAVSDATTAVAADIKNVSSSNTATLNTTAAGRNSYGEFISVANSISSGANTLTSVGSYIDNTSSGANITAYSLYTDHGDVRLNATNGITGIKGPLNVDNTNSSATATSAQFNYTATAQTGSGAAALGTNSGTFNTTAGTITSYGVKGSATSTRSSGANNLVNVGLYGTASGAQLNYASYLDGDERIKGHELFNTAGAPTGSGCTLDANSTDALGLVTMSTASTTLCTVTFNTAFPVTPFCTCSGGNNGTVQALADCEGASTTTMTIHAGTATSVGKFTYRCGSHE